jgi:heat shock protein HtpX
MAITYTEIEQQKNTRIFIFFAVVLLFYFIIAVILANVTKFFFLARLETLGKAHLFLTGGELLYVILFASIAALLHSVYSISNATTFIVQNLKVQIIDLSDKYHKQFNDIVEEVNVATGNKYKIAPMVIPTVAMNAFAISDYNKNAIVGVTEGLLSKLTREQLEAVVAHEVGHIVSGDSFQTTIGCALFGIYAAMLGGLRKIFQGGRIRVSGRGGGGIILFLFLVYIILNIMQFFYNLIRLFVSRDRELRSDAISVRLTRDPISLSEALYAISRGWRGLGYIDRNLESLFIINPAREVIDEKEGFWANLLSTHPPINKRIAILAEMAHTDVKDIQEKVVSQEKLKEGMRENEIQAEIESPHWMAMDNQKMWQGPFTMPQIMTLGWMKPQTWIKPLDSEAIKQAKDEQILKPFFDDKIQGLTTSSFNCPQCHQALIDEDYEGATVYRCVFCDGVLLEKDKLPRIIIRQEKGFSERIKKMARLTQQNGLERIRSNAIRGKEESFLKCPKCGVSMVRGFYTMAYLVEVDRCNFCNLVWFDKDELDVVQCMIENKETGLPNLKPKGS